MERLSIGIYPVMPSVRADFNVEEWIIFLPGGITISAMTLNRPSLRCEQQRKCESNIRGDVQCTRRDLALWQPLPYQLFATRPYRPTDGRGSDASRFHRAGHFVYAHFRTCLAFPLQIAWKQRGNCEFCALNAPRGLPRYQVLLFPLWTASQLLRIKGRTGVPRD